MPDLLSFLSVVFITTFTPGPNNIMSMCNASKYGFRKSFRFNLGIFAGFLIIMALCTVFSATLSAVIPGLKPYMQLAGALYILWLAWKTYKSKPGTAEERAGINTFQSGFLLQFVNPKVILYGITLISTFVIPYYDSLPQLMGFSVFLATVGFISTCCWALFGSLFQKLLTVHSRQVNAVMALMLVYCAASLFI